MADKSDAYNEGAAAHSGDLDVASNPYEVGTVEYLDWNAGHIDTHYTKNVEAGTTVDTETVESKEE